MPLVIREPASEIARGWVAEDPAIVTWAWTRVEMVSALERRVRDGSLGRTERRLVLDRFLALAESWDEVADMIAVRNRAMQLLARQPIRAADAGQLAAALLVAEQGLPGFTFVCLDERLARAAELEGLRVLCA